MNTQILFLVLSPQINFEIGILNFEHSCLPVSEDRLYQKKFETEISQKIIMCPHQNKKIIFRDIVLLKLVFGFQLKKIMFYTYFI